LEATTWGSGSLEATTWGAGSLDATARGSGSFDPLELDLTVGSHSIGRFHHGVGGTFLPRRIQTSALSILIRRLSLVVVASADPSVA
jgi:hypothetical protein